ncbi:unnamed protein product, partial [Heterotrigona itama]
CDPSDCERVNFRDSKLTVLAEAREYAAKRSPTLSNLHRAMKTAVSTICPVDYRHRPSFLLSLILVIVFPILVSTNAQKTDHANAYVKKSEDNSELPKNLEQSKIKSSRDQRDKQSIKSTNENSPALNKFLDDVLKAQNDLRWIDQTVNSVNRGKNNQNANKLREKRGSDENYEDPLSQGLHFDNDILFKRDIDLDDVDTYQKGKERKEVHLFPMYDKETIDDQISKDWSNSRDLCSLSNWLNSNKNPRNEQDKSGDRWIHDYETNQKDRFSNTLNLENTINVRNQRNDAPSLESLKETILELKKSLNEGDKEQRENSKSVDPSSVEDDEREKEPRDKHRKDENDEVETNSGWREEKLNVREREQKDEDADEKNARPRAWRTKRTEVNNDDDGNPKLFRRAEFGPPYPEQTSLKELRDRERRSKGTPERTDEKRRLNDETPGEDNNSGIDEKNSIETSKARPGDSARGESSGLNNVQRTDTSKDYPGDTVNPDVSKVTRDENKDAERAVGDGERSNLNSAGDRLAEKKGKGESLEANSLRTFESRGIAASNQENIGSSKGELGVIEVFEPRQERTSEENERSFPRSGEQGRRSADDSGNIDILLKSENKNLVKFSNQAGENSQADGDRPPFALNVLDVRKKTLMENEEKPGSSVSTVVDVKIEKSRVDTPVQGACQRVGSERSERDEQEVPVGGEVLDFRTDKVKGDTPASASRVTMARNGDEKRLKNSARVDKGPSGQSGAERARGNWLGAAAREPMPVNVDQTAAEKCNDLGGKDEFTSGEGRFSDNKEKGLSNGAVRNVKSNVVNEKNEEGRNKKYKEIFIMTNGMDDRVMNDRYGQRRMLQYMEYSNDDVEDADASYSDKEEEENAQREDSSGKSNAPARRKERSAYSDKKKAKVNVLIKEKIKKKKKLTGRERRNPSVIEYYDYDDLDQQDRESSPTSEQERMKNNYQDENIIDSYAGHAESNQKCPQSTEEIKDEQEEAIQKEIKRKEKLKNKKPQQQFLSPAADTRNATRISKSPTRSTKVVEEQGSSGNQRSGSRLNEPAGRNEDKFLDSDTNEVIMDPEKYFLKMDANLDVIDDFLDDIQYLDEKKGKVSDSVKPLYEELKKIYDWNEDESRESKLRIKGDQRMYHESNDKPCSTEPSNDQIDPSEVRDDATETTEKIHSSQSQLDDPPNQIATTEISTLASSPNLLPLLLVHAGSGKSEIGERIYQSVSSGEREGPATAASANVSQSNYFALKSTDDMFKGGPEQGNSTGEKLRGPARAIETAREWQTQKVSGVRNEGAKGRDAVSWSLTDRGQYIDTDSQRSPYGDRKYPALPQSPERERVQNIDREKQTIVSSRDLHESFVEPVQWFDDFDKDARVRLARGLKTVDTDALVARPGSSATKHERSSVNGSIDRLRKMENGTSLKTEDSPALLVTYSRSSLDTRLSEGDSRYKREIVSPYDTYYEDEDRYSRDYEETDDDEDDLEFFNSYEDVDGENGQGLSSEENLERYDYDDDYEDVDLKSKEPRIGKKHRKKLSKKRKKKDRVGKSSENHGKRQGHRKKHSNDSKTKDRKNQKREKSASKSGSRRNVEKSKVTQNGGRNRSEEGEDCDDVEGEDTTNSDNDSEREKFTTLLITTDDMEDESQMDSALHGELAGKIVQQIFDQVQKNEELKVSLGPGLYQKHKTRDTAAAEKSYRETLNDDEIKNTKELLDRIMLLLNRLIFDEVQRKTCISLPSDLIEFLDWMLQVDTQQANSLEQVTNRSLEVT